jgi:hypothetical protein
MKLYDEVAKIAHELYEKSGKEEGRDLFNWLEAERIVMARYGKREKIETESSASLKKKKSSSPIKTLKIGTKAKKTEE